MTDMLKATRVGDSWRDSGGSVAKIVSLSATRKVVSRKGAGFPTYSVFAIGPDGRDMEVLASGLRSREKALAI